MNNLLTLVVVECFLEKPRQCLTDQPCWEPSVKCFEHGERSGETPLYLYADHFVVSGQKGETRQLEV